MKNCNKAINRTVPLNTFTYDPVGNRLTGPMNSLRYSYNQGNQLLERTKQKRDEEDTRKQYDYDKNGNLIQKLEYDDDGKIKKTTLYSYVDCTPHIGQTMLE